MISPLHPEKSKASKPSCYEMNADPKPSFNIIVVHNVSLEIFIHFIIYTRDAWIPFVFWLIGNMITILIVK